MTTTRRQIPASRRPADLPWVCKLYFEKGLRERGRGRGFAAGAAAAGRRCRLCNLAHTRWHRRGIPKPRVYTEYIGIVFMQRAFTGSARCRRRRSLGSDRRCARRRAGCCRPQVAVHKRGNLQGEALGGGTSDSVPRAKHTSSRAAFHPRDHDHHPRPPGPPSPTLRGPQPAPTCRHMPSVHSWPVPAST